MEPKGNGLLHDGDYPDQNEAEIEARMEGKQKGWGASSPERSLSRSSSRMPPQDNTSDQKSKLRSAQSEGFQHRLHL